MGERAREHGLVFDEATVRAILQGAATQTRRLVGPSSALFDGWTLRARDATWAELDYQRAFVDPGPSPAGNLGPYLKVPRPSLDTVHRLYARFAPGERIWVRESVFLDPDGPATAADRDARDARNKARRVRYAASLRGPRGLVAEPSGKRLCSSELPRWAARLLLRITAVTPTRLGDLTEEVARANGMMAWSKDGNLKKFAPPDNESTGPRWPWGDCPRTAAEAYRRAWEEASGTWTPEAWVWAVDFEVEEHLG